MAAGALTLQIPTRHFGAIIGPRGATVHKIQEDCEVRVNLGKSTEVLVTGGQDNIEKARRAISEIVGYEVGTSPIVRVEIDLAEKLYGRVIGCRGAVINDIQTKSHALVILPRDGAASLEGTQEQVEEALQLVSSAAGVPVRFAGETAELSTVALPTIDLKRNGVLAESIFFSLLDGDSTVSVDRFLAYLSSARESIDVCVFTITDDRVASILLNAHAKGAAVRIITDNDTADNTGSDIEDLKKAGIPVRMDSTSAHMHHKFAILDGVVLLNGSYNWTAAASQTNNENIMATNVRPFITQFSEHFELLWSEFA